MPREAALEKAQRPKKKKKAPTEDRTNSKQQIVRLKDLVASELIRHQVLLLNKKNV